MFYMYSHIEFWMPMHNVLKTAIYSLASASLCMYFDSKNVICNFSGESGAGKTESAKLLISQLVELSKGTSQLEQQILQVLLINL